MKLSRKVRLIGAMILLSVNFGAECARAFIHPGGLHTQADFNRMAAKVAANQSPWVDSYNQMTNVWMANLGMPWHPVAQIIRGPSGSNYARSQDDALGIYYHALRWRITGDTNYAEEAIRGCDAWSSTMTNGVGGDSNWALGAGICGYEFAVAGEALRGYTNWSQTSISNYCNFLRIFAGGNNSFLLNHNGTCDSHYWCNWDACNLASLMACGVFCDDTNMFNEAVTYFKQGIGNGNITGSAWYIHTNGLAQWEESGRDQAHTMDGIAWQGVACQVAWNQGMDLYGFDNNRFLRGLEYCSKYNLWNDVPYVSFLVCEGSSFAWGTTALNAGSRGFLPPTWDMFYNHYVNVLGMSAPWTAQAAAALRPDGFYNNANSPDFVGFTTLTCLLDPIAVGAVPGGLTASLNGTNVFLNWWGSAYATNYLVKRATVSGGPYITIGTVPSSADRFFADNAVTSGGTYFYVVSEQDKFGESPNSPEKKISFGQLVTYYPFNESSGVTASESSGQVRSSATLMNGATFVAGKFGNAVSLNGSSQYLQLPYGLLTGLGDFTISAWVYWNGGSAWQRIFDFGADTDRYMFLTPSAGSNLRFAITKFGGNGEQQINGTSVLATGGWHHLAVTLQGSEGTGVGILYVDGVPKGTNSAMFYTPDMIGSLVNASNCWVGRSQFPGDPYFNGKIDDFRIYSGALSAAQITALYNLTPVLPAAPTALSATAVSVNAINLSWPSASGAASYTVQRALTSGGPYTVVASGVTATNYTDTGLGGGTTYYYVVAPVNGGGMGTNSPEAGATTLTPPAAPTGLNATGLYGGQIALSWAAGPDALSFNIKRSLISGGPYVTVVAGVTTTGFTNSGLVFNATYYYVVSAVDANGESINSSEAGATVPVPTLTWAGNVNTNWDVAQTTNWIFGGSPSTYFVDGAAVLFNDNASNGLVNLSVGVAPYSVSISNATLNYTIGSTNGSGIGGAASLTKLGSGTATLIATNTFTGDITINGGGTLAIGGGGLLGGGNYSGNIASYGTFSYNSSAAQTLSGNISLGGALSKSGAGMLSLTKANDYSGATTVNSGQLSLTGNGGILSSSSILIGNSSGASAALSQAGANTLVNPKSTLGALQVGSTPGGYGYYNFSSGSINLTSEMDVGGSSGGAGTFGQFDMTGGNVVMPNSTSTYFLLNRGGAGESSVVNITGGTVNVAGNATPANGNWAGITANWSGSGAGQTNSTTISNTGQFVIPSLNVNMNQGGNAANVMSLNLDGGLLQVLGVYGGGGATLINFNGGTLKAGITGGLFLSGLTKASVYGNGAFIDDNGQSIAIDQPLLAPAGNGVVSIPVAAGGMGYVMPPQVIITGGGGSNATAYAAISGGAVSSITVTCPGAGYASAPTVRLVGGGYTTVATLGTVALALNNSGGLTKLGSGTLTLSGTNTYTGPTVIAAGTLKLGGPLLYLSFDNTNGATVYNQGSGGAALNGVLTGTNVVIVSGGHSGKALMVSNGPVNSGYVLVNNPVVNFNNSGAWTWGMWIKTTNAGAAYMYQGAGGWVSGNTSFYLNAGGTSSGAKGGGVRYAQGWEEGATVLNDGKWHYIAMTCNSGTKVFYVDGAVDAWTANSWSGSGTGSQLWIGGTADTGDGNAPFNGLIDDVSVFSRALNQAEITNLMAGIKTTSPALPAAANVVIGSGATLMLDSLSQTVGSLSGSNSSSVALGGGSATAFTFGNASNTVFAGSISGSGSVTKNGTGTVTLSGANSYSGATVINAGTVKFGQSDNTNYVASLGPLLWFNFDQGVDAIDGIVTNLGTGGVAMNGILNGNASITNSGRYGNALSLDGASDLEVDNEITPLDCNVTGSSWTYALWIKTSTAGAVYGYQGDGTWSSEATSFYLNNNNNSSGGTKAGGVRWGDAWLTGTTALNNNIWHFIAITVSGGTKTIYVDGHVDAQTGTTGWVAPAMTFANQFLIGQSPDISDGGVPFAGLIDEVYLFNRALSLTEVQNIMANRSVDTLGTVTGQLPVASPVSLASGASLDLAGTFQTIASLSDGAGGGGLVTNSVGTSLLILNTSGSNIFSGMILDTPTTPLGLVKSGGGTQLLAGSGVINGSMIVSNGTLLVNGSMGANGVTVAAGTLGGSGNIGGAVTVQAAGSLWPSAGGAIARLVCSNDLYLSGTTLMALNKAASTNDSVAIGGHLSCGGLLTVTNLGGVLANGDNFQLFSAAAITNSFASTNLPVLGAGLVWNLNLTSGVLSVVPSVSTVPTNIAFAINNNMLTLSWPADHTGWRLQAQTNSLAAGLGTNWVDVANSTSVNQVSVPMNATNGSVFYRMVYP